VLVAVGGSATTDGGLGALEALREAELLDAAAIEVLCDVETPYEEAARAFGPQKGAEADAVISGEGRFDAQSLEGKVVGSSPPAAVPRRGSYT
jgi:glycerate kinase